MSRIAKKPVQLPNGVSAEYKNGILTVKGPLGEEKLSLMKGIDLEIADGSISLRVTSTDDNEKKVDAAAGLVRSLVQNMVTGVSQGFEKHLEIVGVGYRATQQKNEVQLQLGFSHPVVFSPPAGVTVEVLEPTKLRVKGINKEIVGQVAANIRKIRPPEPYKGKGIRYRDENVRKKAGKTGK